VQGDLHLQGGDREERRVGRGAKEEGIFELNSTSFRRMPLVGNGIIRDFLNAQCPSEVQKIVKSDVFVGHRRIANSDDGEDDNECWAVPTQSAVVRVSTSASDELEFCVPATLPITDVVKFTRATLMFVENCVSRRGR
jgi:hypothetical protein